MKLSRADVRMSRTIAIAHLECPLVADFVAELGDYYVQGVAAFFSARP
jgi:hypothetical protein